MKYGSLFSGIEAASVAWGPLGWECAWVAEIDPFACAVLQHRYPQVPNLGDVTELDADAIEPVQLVVFGSPCQSFSVAGKRLGLDDSRGNLALVALRLVSRIRPRWLVFENVPGLLSSDAGRDFGAFLGLLGECGYGWSYRILDAQYFGVPQRRRRIFLVGHLGDWRPAAAVLFEPESLRGDPPPRREEGERAAGSTLRSSNGGGNAATNDSNLIPQTAACLTQGVDSGGKGGYDDVTGVPATNGARATDTHTALRFRAPGHSEGSTTTVIAVDLRNSAEGDTAMAVQGGGQGDENLIAAALRGNPWSDHAGDESRLNRQGAGIGDHIAHTVSAEFQPAVAVPILEVGKRTNGDGSRDGDGLGQAGDPMYTLQAGAQHAVAFAQNQRGELRTSEIAPQLTTGGGKPGEGYPAVAFQERGRDSGRNLESQEDLAYSLNNPGEGSRRQEMNIATAMSVRRLLPIECERLQGLPDNWTLVPYRGKPAADGPRYRAIGNSMAVPVVRWIGERIQQFEEGSNGS